MTVDVNATPRRYESALRRGRARATRAAVHRAAHRLFLERGFAETTVAAVAEAAGVSQQTVYKVFGNKVRLAKSVFDVAIAGDDEPLAMIDRTALRRVREAGEGRRKLELYGAFLAETAPRHCPLQLVIRDAACHDSEAAAVWAELQDERLRAMTRFARSLRSGGHLRRGVSEAQARDVLWAYNSAELFDLLVGQRGWTPERYGRWVAAALIAALL